MQSKALWQRSTADLETAFQAGQAPDLDKWQGRLAGQLLQLESWENRSALLRGWRTVVASRVLLWAGKDFLRKGNAFEATNLTVSFRWPVKALRMDLSIEPSLVTPDKDVLAVRYDRPENPGYLHRRLRRQEQTFGFAYGSAWICGFAGRQSTDLSRC